MLTVLLATRNGAPTLPALLEAFARLEPPPGGWSVVIVDNGSTDRTGSIITSYQGRLPLTCLFEPAPGKNAALNRGLSAISGDLVVLTDDDIVPRTDWLRQLRAAADAHPEFTVFGGTVLPRWETPPEEWVLAWVPLGPAYAISSPSFREGPASMEMIFGPNMAVRAHVFEEGYRFDPRIGPRGRDYAMGSETEFLNRLAKDGLAGWYCRDAVVEHLIRSDQLQRNWILRRAVRFGRGRYRLGRSGKSRPAHLWFGVPRYLFREWIHDAAKVAGAWLSRDAEQRFLSRWRLAYCLGQIVESRQIHQEPAPGSRAPR